ncbi:hypothetical protein IM40_03870 [Candidatus Paracaedimonas acanthamoebae]|nr:hypothetical protein IM40_03870 [Candidatus Paracaedimonas acanthamoebae]
MRKLLKNLLFKRFIYLLLLCFINSPASTSPIYIHSFATNNAFQQPSGIAVDPITGRVFVSDTIANTVYSFKSTGIGQSSFFSAPNSKPLGIATSKRSDGSPNIWIMRTPNGTDTNYRISEYALSNGSLLSTSSTAYSTPTNITVRTNVNGTANSIYLTTPDSEIKVYNVGSSSNSASIPLNANEIATGFSVNSLKGILYTTIKNQVTDQGRVSAIDTTTLNAFDFSNLNGNLVEPVSIVTLNTNTFGPVWILDKGLSNIQYYATDTNPPNYQYKDQTPIGELNRPIALALNESTGQLYALETGSGGRIRMFFAPEAWTQPGRSILQQLTLDRDYTISDGRSLRVSTTDDDNNPIGGSGIFKLISPLCQLSLPSTMGQPLEADSFIIEDGAQLWLDGGALKVGAFQLDNGTIIVNQDATFSPADIPSLQLAENNTFDIQSGKNLTISSPLSGNGGLNVTSSSPSQGILKLTADNSAFSGPLDVDEATVMIGSNPKPLGTNTVTLRSNAILTLEADATLQNNFVIGTRGNINTVSNNVTNKGILTGSIGESGASTMHVWGDLTTEGNVNLTGIGIEANSQLTTKGPFTKAPSISIASNSVLDLSYQSQTVKDLNGSAVTSKVKLGSDKTLTLESDDDSDYKGTIEGGVNASVVKAGNGNLTLYSNAYGGNSLFQEGSVTARSNTSFGTSTIKLSNNTALQFGIGGLVINNPLVLDSGSSGNPGVATIDTGGFASILSGAITQIGASVMKLIIQGGNVLTLNNVASHSGGIEVQDDTTFKAGIANAVSGNLNLLGQNTIFDMRQADQSLGGLQGGNTSQVLLDTRTLTLTQPSNFDGIFSGLGGNITAKNNLTLGGQNTNTGLLTADATANPVTVKMEAGSSLAAESSLSLISSGANKAIFNMADAPQTLASLDGNVGSEINLGDKTLTLDIDAGNDSTFEGVIQGVDGKIVKQGEGTWRVSGNNDYSGGTTLSAGTVQVRHNSALGTGVVSLEGGTLQADQNVLTLDNDISLGASSTIDNNGKTLTFSGDFSSASQGILEFIDSSVAQNGTTILSGQGTFSDKLITLSTQLTNSGAMTLEYATILENNNQFTNTGTITIDASSISNRKTFINIGEIINNDRFFNFDLLRLDANSKWSGAGSLRLSGSTTLFNGPGIEFNNNIELNPNFVSSQGITLSVVQGVTQSINNVISSPNGSVPLTKNGLGTLVLNGANIYEGGTEVKNGTISISSDSNLGKAYHPVTAPDAIITLGTNTGLNDTSGMLKFTNGPALTLNRPITLNQGGGIFDIGNNPVTLSGVISGNGSLTKKGIGYLMLNAQNLYSGGTTISSGGVEVRNNTSFGTGPVTMGSGTTLKWGADAVFENAFKLSGTVTTNTNGFNGALKGAISDATLGAGKLLISDNLTLGQAGSPANTYSGGTDISANKAVTLFKSGALGTGAVTMANATTLKFGAPATITNPMTLNGNTVTINTGGYASTLSGAISQAVGTLTNLIIKGGSILTLGGVMSHQGGTAVQAGTTLKAGLPNIFVGPNKSLSLVGIGSTFDMSLGSQVLSDLTGDTSSIINLGGNTLTFGTGNDSTFEGVIQGVGGKVVKQGTGTWFVSGQNTYSGGTTLEKGTIAISDNSTSLGTGPVTMADGTMLKWGSVNTLNNGFILNTVANNPVGITFDGTTTSGGLAGVISGPGKLIMAGEIWLGNATQQSPNTYSRETYFAPNSTIAIFKNGALGTGAATFGNNTTLSWGADGTLSNPFSLNGVVTMEPGGYLGTLNGSISGGGKLIVANDLSLGGQNTFTGGLELPNGYTAVTFSTNTALGAGPVAMADNTTLYWGANVTVGNKFTLNAAAPGPHQGISFDTRTFLSTLTGVIEGANKLLIKGSGTLISKAQNLLTGGIELCDSATFALGTGGGLPNNSDVTLRDQGTTFDISLAAPVTLRKLNGQTNSRVILGNNKLTLKGNSLFKGVFNSSSGGRVIVDGSSTLTLGGANSALGTLQVNENGKVVLTQGASLAATTSIILADENASFDASASGNNLILSSLQGSANTSFKWGNQSLMLNGSSVVDGTLEGGVNSQVILNADLTLGGENLKTPLWTINEAKLTMKASSTLPSNSSLIFTTNDSVFDMSAQNQTVASIFSTNSQITNSQIDLGDKTLTVNMLNAAQPSAFAGQIKGNGGKVVKRGLAFLTFRGNNTFSGGLTIEEGGIRISSLTAQGSGPITLHDQTTLNIGTPLTLTNPITLQGGRAILQTDSPTTIASMINGAGGFDKTGSSSLTLTKANLYIGDTHVKGGTLVVDGSIGNVTVDAGATLTGTSSVGTVVNNSIVTPSDPVGIFTIRGDYLPSSQGITQIAVNSEQSNKLHVEGTAHLNNSILSVQVTPGDNNAYENHPPFEVLSSDNLIDGQFGAIQSSHVRYKWVADYIMDPNKVFLKFDGHVLFEEIVRSVSDNPNYIASAHYFDNLSPVPGSDLSNIISIFNSRPEAHGITDIFSEISPDELLQIQTEETATLINEINGFRMHYLRDMATSAVAVAAFTTTKNQRATSLMNHIKQAFGQMKADGRQARGSSMALNIGQQMQDNALMMGPKGGIWIQGFGNYSKQKSTARDLGYRNRVGGSLIGVDYKFKPDLFVGASIGYDQSRIKWTGGVSQGRIRDYLASVYSTWFHNKLYINASITGAYNRYNIRRRMTFATIDRTARSRHNGYVLAPSLEIGHGFTLINGIEVVPFIREDYVHIHEKGYQEKDAGALNLHIRSKTNTSLRTEPGLNFYRHYKLEEGLLTAKVKLSYVNKHPLKKGEITANLVGQPGSFLAAGSNKTQHQFSPGLSLDYKANSGLFISAAYDAQFSAKYKAHEISLKLGHKF